MGAQTAGLQESLKVMEAQVREWDKREQLWEREKGELEGSVAEAQLRARNLVLAKDEAERSLHELQGAQVQLEMDTSAAIKANEALKAKNRELSSTNRTMFSAFRDTEEEIARLQKEVELMKQAKGDSAFVPSGFEDLAAQKGVADRAADLTWQLKKAQVQMKKMKEQADELEAEWEAKVAAAEQECVVAETDLATARSSGSVHNKVWDGSLNTTLRGKHLLAIKEAGEASLQNLLHDLNEAKVRAQERGPHGKLSMADMCGFLSTLHTRHVLMSAEAKRRQVIPSPEELQDIERPPLGAEVLFWVMKVHDEKRLALQGDQDLDG